MVPPTTNGPEATSPATETEVARIRITRSSRFHSLSTSYLASESALSPAMATVKARSTGTLAMPHSSRAPMIHAEGSAGWRNRGTVLA